MMHGHDPGKSTAENYREFAQDARGRSPAYEALAGSVAEDPVVLGFLSSLPPEKRQPNLLFAAARYLLGGPAGPGSPGDPDGPDDPGPDDLGGPGPDDLGGPDDLDRLRDLIRRDGAGLAGVMMARRTQTNEPARCATLLPALAQMPAPLALIEVGASAGLTMLFDRYSYDYAGHRIAGQDPHAPVLRCAPQGPVPLPAQVPDIAWRAGLDLNPLDVTCEDDTRWLSCLVWPSEGDRAQRLAAAIASARRDPPVVHRGDLLTDLPALAAQAPAGATLVIYHSAVLAYVAPPDRLRFAGLVRGLGAVWLSSEGPGVVPGVPVPSHHGAPFVLARDGRTPLAIADGHGAWLRWLPAIP
jgi:hypothetical protein